MFRKENFEICKTSQNFVKSFKSPKKCTALIVTHFWNKKDVRVQAKIRYLSLESNF